VQAMVLKDQPAIDPVKQQLRRAVAARPGEAD
jgi:hypothetical protein